MVILLNGLIVLFLLAMLAMWATYGFFSAFLHLVIVIVSGVIAFAVWEPLAYMLLGRMPEYAWGMALLAPFALTLIVSRALMDKYCKMNLKFPRLADQIGGGGCGVLSGVLSIGMLMLGIGFMNVPSDLMGYKPYRMASNGIEQNPEGGALWVPAHKITGGFFSMLSSGAMAPTLSDASLAVTKSNVAERAFTYRLQDDENQMKSAHPDAVKVTGAYLIDGKVGLMQEHMKLDLVRQLLNPEFKLPEEPEGATPGQIADNLIDVVVSRLADANEAAAAAAASGEANTSEKVSGIINAMMVNLIADRIEFEAPVENFESFVEELISKRTGEVLAGMEPTLSSEPNLLIVDTVWNKEKPGTYNTDGWLRIAIPQIRLQILKGDDEYELIAPIAYSLEVNKLTGERVMVSLTSQQVYAAYTQDDDVKIGWFFKLPENATPTRMEIRQLGFDLAELGEVNTETFAVAKVLGSAELPEKEADPTDNPSTVTDLRGVNIGTSGARAELTEQLPKALSPNSATQIEPDKSNPKDWSAFKGYQLLNATSGTGGGRASRMQQISVPSNSRLIRITIDPNSAQSLYGQARQLAANLQVMQVRDTTGNASNAIAYVLLKADGSQEVAIRVDSSGQEITSLRANQLPRPGPGDKLYVYFQVLVGRTVNGFSLGGQVQDFETPIEVTEKGRR